MSTAPRRPAATSCCAHLSRRTVSTTVRDNAEITVVGELPPQTAKRISDSIKFKAVQ
ncbi:MucB/RseB C-terminal domain-containing protein [Klebsiella pneumoniae]|nr:MucB/RseB C-terminal domain-containing protein [Klebsiella pneumoniae]